MQFLLGWILLIELLLSPVIGRIDPNHKMFMPTQQPAMIVKSQQEALIDNEVAHVDTLFSDISKNKRELHRLVRRVNGVAEGVQKAIRDKAHSRTSMTDEQIQAFQAFVSLYPTQITSIQQALHAPEQEEILKHLQIEIMKAAPDVEHILVGLTDILLQQEENIDMLLTVIDKGEAAMVILCGETHDAHQNACTVRIPKASAPDQRMTQWVAAV